MGYVRSTFFIIRSAFSDDAHIKEARERALLAFAHAPKLVGPIMSGVVNSERGFIVWTSGSKIGWEDANEHETAIADLIKRLSAMDMPPRWCRVDSGEEVADLSAEHGEDGNWTHTYKRKRVPRAR